MFDCQNVAVREALPDFLHGTLDAVTRDGVGEHVALCGACAEELALLRQVLAGAPQPAVDVARIVAAVSVASASSALALVSEPVSPISASASRQAKYRWWPSVATMRLAATLLLVAAGISVVQVSRQSAPRTIHRTGAVQNGASVSSEATGGAGIDLVSVGDLSDDHLQQLIDEMDQLEAAPPTEPEPVIAPVVSSEGGEGL